MYDAMLGKTSAMHQRFSNHTLNSFERAGIDSIAFWTEIVGTSNRLVYMLGYSSLGDREKCWTAHLTNAEWRKARAESEKDGPLVRATHHTLIRPTPYSPRWFKVVSGARSLENLAPVLPAAGGPSSIHHVDTSGAKAAFVTGEEQHHIGYFLGVSIALERYTRLEGSFYMLQCYR